MYILDLYIAADLDCSGFSSSADRKKEPTESHHYAKYFSAAINSSYNLSPYLTSKAVGIELGFILVIILPRLQ